LTVKTGTDSKALNLNDTLEFIAGSNITLGVDLSTGAVTINSTATNNTFSTIAVAGQSNVVADSTSDTLTLVAGTNITLTTNATADSITISSASTTGTIIQGTELFFPKYRGTTGADSYTLELSSLFQTNYGISWLENAFGPNFQLGTTNNGNIILNPHGTGSIELSGPIITDSTTGTPSNTSSPASWLKVTVSGTTRYIPLYS
jgi:hypothetical protein